MIIPTIVTPRLRLRPFSAADIDPMHRILNGENVLRYFPKPGPPSRERVEKMVFGLLSHWEEHGYGLWAVESRATGELMGRCGLQLIPDTSEVEVDFILGEAFWGQGFATEAAQASVQYGFEKLGVETIVGIVHPDNRASQRVLEKLGMRLIERTRYFGMDCYRYALSRTP